MQWLSLASQIRPFVVQLVLASAPLRALRGLLVAILTCVAAAAPTVSALSAQGAPAATRLRATAPRRAQVSDLAERHFDRRDGIRSNSVYSVSVDREGQMWAGTEDGALRYTGDVWTDDETPTELRGRQVRAVLHDADGGHWFATRSGVWYAKGTARRHYGVIDGLPDPVVYSLIETRAVDGQRRVVAGSRSGVSYLVGERFEKLVLPTDFRGVGVVLAEGRGHNGVLALWAASADGPVARYAARSWTVFGVAQGLVTPSAEQLRVTPVAGQVASRVLVAGAGGLFVLEGRGDDEHFTRVPGSPQNAFRVADAAADGDPSEVWVGTRDGYVYRHIGSTWERVRSHLIAGRGSVLALETVRRADGGTALFVGVGGERLTRLAVGSAATVDFPDDGPRESIVAMHADVAPNGRAELWLGSNGGRGVVHIGGDGRYRQFSRATGEMFSNVHSVTRDEPSYGVPRGGDGAVWIGTDAGAFRWSGERWIAVRAGMPAVPVWSLDRAAIDSSASAWFASTSTGLFRWSGERWTLLPGTEKLAVHGMLSLRSPVRSANDLLLVSTAGIWMRDGARWNKLPVSNKAPNAHDLPVGTSMCAIRGNGGAARVFVGTGDGAIYTLAQRIVRGVLVRDTGWTRLPEGVETATNDLSSLRCEQDGRVVVGTNRGLVVVDVSAPDMSAWRATAAASLDDGMPPGNVMAIASRDVAGVRFVGTPNGIGAVHLARATVGPPPSLVVQLSVSGRAGTIAEWERLPNGSASVVVRPSLRTDHREDASRFHVELVPLGGGSVEALRTGARSANDDEWTDDPTRNYEALAPGEYLLRVRARDFVGRETAPFERRFAVAPAPWRSAGAILAYVVCLLGIAVGAHYWRVAGVQRSHARVVEGEARARASERRFRALFDESVDGHLLASDGIITAANNATLALFGVEGAHGLLGRRLESLVALPAADGSQVTRTHETTLVREGGEKTPVSFTLMSIPGDEDALEHGVLRDLTAVRLAEQERVKLEARIRESQNLESLGTLAGGVAHDFNNLLGVIRGNAELAQIELDEPARVTEHLVEILDASGRARDLVRQILTFSRRSSQESQQVDLSALVRDMQPMLRRILPASVVFRLHGLDAQRLVEGDATQLQQVVLNLVSNAEYALRQNVDAELDITLSDTAHPEDPHQRMVRLSVSDNGVGMPSAVRDRIFEPFYSTKPTGEGTGLGLAVLHGVVVSHRGAVQVESAEGAGTVFSVLFPATERRAELRPLSRTPLDVRAVTGVAGGEASVPPRAACVVLVDDEPSVARVVDRVLTRAGHKVHTFANPLEALRFVEADPSRPDLLVTDQTMPGMTGDVLALSVRAMRNDLPVLILTGFSHRLTQERLDELGAVAVLQKPVAIPALLAAVGEALAAGSAA